MDDDLLVVAERSLSVIVSGGIGGDDTLCEFSAAVEAY